MCACVHTMGMEDLENRGKEQCLQILTHKFPPMNPAQHCPIIFWASSILTSVSPGDVDGQLLRLPSQIPLDLPELISIGNQIQLSFSGKLASCPTQKSYHTSTKEHEKPMPVSALGPATSRMPIPVKNPHQQAMTKDLSKMLSHSSLYSDLGAWVAVLL